MLPREQRKTSKKAEKTYVKKEKKKKQQYGRERCHEQNKNLSQDEK